MPFPRNEAEINALLQLWKLRAADHKTRYQLLDDQINQIIDDAVLYDHNIKTASQFEEDIKEFYVYKLNAARGVESEETEEFPTIKLPALPAPKNVYKKGIETRGKELYNYFKSHPNRTNEALADLGIGNSAKPPVAKDTLKPTLQGKLLTDDKVELTFKMLGQRSCRIQCRLVGADWKTVGEPSFNPWVDETPSVDGKPEKREYRAILLEKNQPIGQYSDIITVYTAP